MSGNFSSFLSSISGESIPQPKLQPASRPTTPHTQSITRPIPTTAAPRPDAATSVKQSSQIGMHGSNALKRKREDIAFASNHAQNGERSSSAQARPATPSESSRPSQSAPSLSNQKIAVAALASSTQSTKPPPKGSYQALLARASAAKPVTFGEIKHKAIEKRPKQRRSETPEVKEKPKGHVRSISALAGQNGKMQGGKPGERNVMDKPAKPKRKPLELDYKGTMRPNAIDPSKLGRSQPSATPGRPHLPQPSRSRLPERPAQKAASMKPSAPSRLRYASYSEEEEEDEGEDYDDEGSDEMEGGGFDELMAEEERSLRAARREDEEAHRQETEHRRQKTEKKKALEKLAAARRIKNGG